MSDTLRERLWNLATEVRSDDDRKMLCDAIAELDRLEAEVKKPRLPEGWSLQQVASGKIWLEGPGNNDSLIAGCEAGQSNEEGTLYKFLSTFLPQTAPVHDDTEVQRQSWLKGEMAMGESVAEKPKPVSLVEAFERERMHPATIDRTITAYDMKWLCRKLDERSA